jgi:PAS domain S-box-containing protein
MSRSSDAHPDAPSAHDVAVALLIEAGAVLASSLDPATTTDQLARLIVPRLADLCVIDLSQDDGSIRGTAVAAADEAMAAELDELRRRHPLDPAGEHPAARVIRTGEPILMAEVTEALLESFAVASPRARFVLDNGYRSAAVAPLVARDRTLGSVSVLRHGEAPPFDEDDLVLVCELARRAALAIDNAQLYARARSVEQRLDAVLASLAEAVTVVDRDGRTIFANQAAADLLGLDSADDVVGAPPGAILSRFLVTDEEGRQLDLDRMPARRLLRGLDAPPLLVRNVVRATGEERWLIVRASAITDLRDDTIAYAVNVFENVTEMKRAQLAERFMSQASQLLASSMDYTETLEQIAHLAVPQLADWCAVDVLNERGQLERVALHHTDPGKLAVARELHERYVDDSRAIMQVIGSGEPLLATNIAPEALSAHARDSEHLAMLEAIAPRSAIIVPIAGPTRTLGAITLLSSSESERQLTEADVDLAVRLGRRAGTAVENSRLYTERSQIAQTLQRALLPEALPEVPHVELAAWYSAAGELNEVGGDFYDVIPCGERGWMLVIGDVCGKGPEAASVTALARHTLRAVSMLEASPGAMLELLHRTLSQQEPDGQMCTVCLVLVCETAGEVTLTVALGGHPCPLLVGPGEEAHPIGEPGTVLGIVDPVTVSETSVVLGEEQTLILFTDGVTEAARSALRGAVELTELASRSRNLPVRDMLAVIERAAVDSGGGHPHDDIALLGIRIAVGGSSDKLGA